MSGVSTNNLPAARSVDDILGNREGSTVRIPLAYLTTMIMGGMGPSYRTLVSLVADQSWPDGAVGAVWGDTDPSRNGIYKRTNGSWSWIGPLPMTTLAADLIRDIETRWSVLSSGIRPRGIWDSSDATFPPGAQAGDMWYVSALATIDGQTVSPGDQLMALVDDASITTYTGNWVLVKSASIVQPLQLKIDAITSTPRLTSQIEPHHPESSPAFYEVTGRIEAGDGGAAVWRAVTSEPSHSGKVRNAKGTWYVLASAPVPEVFDVPGTALADAAFTALETVSSGRTIDLGGRTYSVTQIPKGNKYVNGYFTSGGSQRSTITIDELDDESPVVSRYGGQLAMLHKSLGNPFDQRVSIVLIGDSITWGSNLPEMATEGVRDQTLSDPRDNFATASWANELKRWIGRCFAEGNPALSNWPASPSGQSIATYSKDIPIFPAGPRFTITQAGSSMSKSTVYNAAYPYGAQLQLLDGSGGSGHHSLKFKMTGDEVSVHFGSNATGCLDYEIWVNGTQVGGTHSTTLGYPGAPAGKNIRHHSIPFVKNGDVEVRTVLNPRDAGVQSLYLYGVIFRKKITISNQGLNGASFRTYLNNALSNGGYGDGLAVSYSDTFAFVQLGTNDRGIRPDESKTLAETYGHAANLIAAVKAVCPNIVMMCANAAQAETPATVRATMAQIRQVIDELASENALDLIDNYQLFARRDYTSLMADNVHPNRLGHATIARNVINAIRGL